MKKWLLVELKLSPDVWDKSSIVDSLTAQHMLVGHSEKNPLLKVTKKAQGGGKGKAIGSDYERKIAEKLSAWWGCVFRRTPNSGGWDKVARDGQVLTSGDLYAPPEANFPFSVECKKRRVDINMYNPRSELFDWWAQCVRDAESVKKIPFLIFNTAGTDMCALPDRILLTAPGVIVCSIHDCSPAQDCPRVYRFYMARLNDVLISRLYDSETSQEIKDGRTNKE